VDYTITEEETTPGSGEVIICIFHMPTIVWFLDSRFQTNGSLIWNTISRRPLQKSRSKFFASLHSWCYFPDYLLRSQTSNIIKNLLLHSVTYEPKVLQFGSWMRSLELQLYLGFFWFPLCIWFMQIRIDNVQRYKVAGKTINMVSLIKLQVYLFSFKIYLMKSNKGWSISIGLLYNWGI